MLINHIYVYLFTDVLETISFLNFVVITFPRFKTFRFYVSVFDSMQPNIKKDYTNIYLFFQ